MTMKSIHGHKKEEAELWAISFADLMSLMFGFFLMLTSLSASPKNCNSLATYFEEHRAEYKNFELKSSKLECVVTLPSDYLFAVGQDQLQASSAMHLKPLFEAIRDIPEYKKDLIIVEGHTDDLPIATRRFHNNWELSSARATNVAGYMKTLGVPEKRLSVRAFAENRPKVPTVDMAGKPLEGQKLMEARKTNRRVEIIIVNPPTKPEEYGVLFRG